MPRHVSNRRGSITVLSAFLLVVLLALLAFTLDLGQVMVVATELQRTADAAAMAAVVELPNEAAVDAMASTYVGLNRTTGGQATFETQFGIWEDADATFALTTADEANAVRVITRRAGASNNSVRLYFARLLGRGNVDLERSAIAMRQQTLCGGLIGVDSVSMSGNGKIDSYNSADGPYHPNYAGSQASVCSDGSISLSGNAKIFGSANPGPGFQVTTSGNAFVTGDTTPRGSTTNLPSVDTSSVAYDNDNASMPMLPGSGKGKKKQSGSSPLDGNNNFSISGNTDYTLPPGTYYWNDLTISGNARLILTPGEQTTVYLTGDFSGSGNGIVNNGVPSNLKILMTGGSGSITGNADLQAIIYAPNTPFSISGNGDFLGTIIAQSLQISGNGDIHFDRAFDFGESVSLPNRVMLVR